MVLSQVVCELLVWGLGEHSLLPKVWSEVGVCLGNGGVGGLGKVAKGGGLPSGAGVAILDTGHLQQLFGH